MLRLQNGPLSKSMFQHLPKYTAKTMVLNLTPVVLTEDHTIWCGPLLTPRVLNLTPQFLQCIYILYPLMKITSYKLYITYKIKKESA